VIKVAKAHGVSGAQVALKWIVQQNISAVTAAHNPAYIAEDIDLWSWGDLTEGEMAALAAI
jgi:diketogulonate reductase-like aldo/keto reductase